MILLIDNYDSFTHNLVQILTKNNYTVRIEHNDKVTVDELLSIKNEIEAIFISPGPGHPKDAGISRDVVDRFHKTHKIFGVCLGHQVMAEYFGAKIVQAPRILHGRTSLIHHSGQSYRGLKQPFQATRYHSLIVENLPESLEKTAWTVAPQGKEEIMGFRHRQFPLEGVQFHPESILSEGGEALLLNFLKN